MAKLIAASRERYGHIDIMVNNAGITHRNRPMLEIGEEEFDRIYAVNVKSIYFAAHLVCIAARRGLAVASSTLFRPSASGHARSQDNGSKGAVINLTKGMAAELGPDKIRVNALCPVAGDTPLLPSFLGGNTEAHRQRFVATVPLGRLSTPKDVANAALYLASDEAEFITGVALEVDGGRCI